MSELLLVRLVCMLLHGCLGRQQFCGLDISHSCFIITGLKKKNVFSGLFHLCANIDAFRFVWGICPKHKHLLAIQMCPAMYSMFYLLYLSLFLSFSTITGLSSLSPPSCAEGFHFRTAEEFLHSEPVTQQFP